jgi:DNA-binding YbaB/EbfC family protein
MAKGFGDMMKQARVLQEKMAKMQEELGDKIVESSVGGGMVVAKANGRQELLSIDLEPEVVDPDDIEMLQDLIVAAVNDALKRSQEMAAEEMSKLTGGLKLPPRWNENARDVLICCPLPAASCRLFTTALRSALCPMPK